MNSATLRPSTSSSPLIRKHFLYTLHPPKNSKLYLPTHIPRRVLSSIFPSSKTTLHSKISTISASGPPKATNNYPNRSPISTNPSLPGRNPPPSCRLKSLRRFWTAKSRKNLQESMIYLLKLLRNKWIFGRNWTSRVPVLESPSSSRSTPPSAKVGEIQEVEWISAD